MEKTDKQIEMELEEMAQKMGEEIDEHMEENKEYYEHLKNGETEECRRYRKMQEILSIIETEDDEIYLEMHELLLKWFRAATKNL